MYKYKDDHEKDSNDHLMLRYVVPFAATKFSILTRVCVVSYKIILVYFNQYKAMSPVSCPLDSVRNYQVNPLRREKN